MTDLLSRSNSDRPAPVRAGDEFTYRQDSPYSYLQDRWRADRNPSARERLKRHAAGDGPPSHGRDRPGQARQR